MRKMLFIARKEFYHIRRDPRSLVIVLLMPIMMTFLYGYAINLDIEHITLAVVDYDHTSASRELIDAFYQSTYFDKPTEAVNPADPEQILRSAKAHAVLVIKPGYGEALGNNRKFTLGMFVDGSDNNMAAAVQNYSQALLGKLIRSNLALQGKPPGITISRQILYNPDLQSSHFFVPGLVAIILVMISALLTSITIAREKETGTMEQLLTAPVKPMQILLGKVMPYIVLAFIDGASIVVMAKFLFDVPFMGLPLLLLAFGLIYIVASLSIGILISTAVKTQQVAMMFALITTMLPSVMLSGFIFPIKNMPYSLQIFSNIIPAKYFVAIMRGIMLKGAGVEVLAVHGLGLIILMGIMLTVASKLFTKQVA